MDKLMDRGRRRGGVEEGWKEVKDRNQLYLKQQRLILPPQMSATNVLFSTRKTSYHHVKNLKAINIIATEEWMKPVKHHVKDQVQQ